MGNKKEDKILMKEMGIDKEKLKRLKKKLEKIEGMPERGVETWFRLTSRNLYTRRQIVDAKSNILVTINSIIMSVILGSLYTKLDDDPHLVWAIIPMILTNITSISFAVFATRPSKGNGQFSKHDIEKKSVRLMTFDDFYKMPENEYEKAIDLLMNDRHFLYSTIKKDIHRLGIDLSHRYKNTRISYDVFLIGLIFSLLMFGVCHLAF